MSVSAHPRLLNRVVAATIAASAIAIVLLLARGGGEAHLGLGLLLVLGGFVLIGELFPLRVAGHEGELTISPAFLFAVLLLAGPVAVVAVQTATTTLAELARRKPLLRVAYNAAQLVLCWTAAGVVWTVLRAPEPLAAWNLIAGAAAALVFFAFNLTLARLPVALHHGRPVIATVRENIAFELWTTLILISLSPVVVALALDHPLLLPMLGLPVIAIHRGGRHAVVNEFLATHDPLTGLANRTLLGRRLEAELRGWGRVSVLLMDLDQFKEINDTLGHARGDDILREVAARLSAAAPGRATVARLGGDEFAVLLPSIDGPDAAEDAAGALLRALEPRFAAGSLSLSVGASIGIACAPEDGDRAELLLQRADIAMYTAKAQQLGWTRYRDEQDHHSPARLQLATELRDAIAGGQLELHYQPLIALDTDSLDRVEALVRWRHPERGLIPPDEFVPLAERTGLIRELTSFALRESVSQLRRWRAAGLSTRVAVNLSVHSLSDDELPGEIAGLLASHGIEPAALELEITEGTVMADPKRAERLLDALRAMGLELAIDDFGTGYSSLSRLTRLPVSTLKIDRAFVMGMETDPASATIVSAIVELAHTLGLEVVAEGVETEAARDRLRELGCQRAQGWLYSKALPPSELFDWAMSRAGTFVLGFAAEPGAVRPASATRAC